MSYPNKINEGDEFIKKLMYHKEFNIGEYENNGIKLDGLRLSPSQTFISNFQNPNTKFLRILLNWQTGSGKTIAAISIAQNFIKQFQLNIENPPSVFIISFTKSIVQEDMLKYSEFGFITEDEIIKLRKLKNLVQNNSNVEITKQLSTFLSILHRRITDKSRGGYYKFYGYKEFSNAIFKITKKGILEEFDLQYIASNEEITLETVDKYVKDGLLEINTQLIEELKNGLLIADEIQNVYNILESNNYGIALQYVLDYLGDNAPRVVLMSATPMTGSPAEVINLLNLLTPNIKLKRSDFFTINKNKGNSIDSINLNDESLYVNLLLKPGALERITEIAKGKISFLLDSDIEFYPKRIFIGELLENIPYLHFIKCYMPKIHEDAIDFEHPDAFENIGLATNSYTLYDMVFPTKSENETTYLYISNTIIPTLINADIEWKREIGINVKNIGYANIITGSFLHIDNIGKYSSKYYQVIKQVLDILKNEKGKIMIFHPKVRLSGILLIQELLKANGIIDDTSLETNDTLCSHCGIAKSKHLNVELDHTFSPTRFIMAHSDIDKSTMNLNIDRFNSVQNLDGNKIRIIVGSTVIKEGLNFKAVRHQLICSLPTDFPTLLQVIGRVNRKNSHIDLPEDMRDAKIYIFINLFSKEGKISPEYQRYLFKGQTYLLIQKIENALRDTAVDKYVNNKKILKNIKNNQMPNIDILKYESKDFKVSNELIKKTTFNNYEYSNIEIKLISDICKKLFKKQSVWTYEDLWKEVYNCKFSGISYDTTQFEEYNFSYVLYKILSRVQNDNTQVINSGKYFILCNVDNDYKAYLDINNYLPFEKIMDMPKIDKLKINLNSYINDTQIDINYNLKLKEFEEVYLSNRPKYIIEMCLIYTTTDFHINLLKKFITEPHIKHTSNDEIIKNLYIRFKIAIVLDDASHFQSKFRGWDNSKILDPKTILIGYIIENNVFIYDTKSKTWYNLLLNDINYNKRHIENNIVVGYITNNKFKLRHPIQVLKKSIKNNDMRNLAKGSMCETRDKKELNDEANKLRTLLNNISSKKQLSLSSEFNNINDIQNDIQNNIQNDNTPADNIPIDNTPADNIPIDIPRINTLDYAAKNDIAKTKRLPSAIDLCQSIKIFLLRLEELSRTDMQNGIRWLYLFSDISPNIINEIG